MAKTLQFRRGTTSELSSQTGAVGELFVDTTKDTVVVMDGSTAGGFPLATESSLSSYATIDNVNQGLATKQDTLLSGTNIKTVNGTSLLGSGNITIAGGGSSFDQDLNTTNDVVFNTALIGDVSIVGNQIGAVDVYGNAGTLVVDGGLEVTAGSTTTSTVIVPGGFTDPLIGWMTATQNGGQNYIIFNGLNVTGQTTIDSLNPGDTLEMYDIDGQAFVYIVESTFGFSAGRTVVVTNPYPEGISFNFLYGIKYTRIVDTTVTVASFSETGVAIEGTLTVNGQPVDPSTKQDTLLSGTNIKTVNGTSLLGSGNITISGSGSSFDQELNTTNDVVFNTALVGDVSIISNTISAIDSYGSSTNLIIDSKIITPALDVQVYTDSSVNYLAVESAGQPLYLYNYPWLQALVIFNGDGVNTAVINAIAAAGAGATINFTVNTPTYGTSVGYFTFDRANVYPLNFGEFYFSNLVITSGYDYYYNTGLVNNATFTITEIVESLPLSVTETGVAIEGTLTVNGQSVDPSTKQDTLVSGTNIKTVNGTSLLGSGDITITGGSGSSFDQDLNTTNDVVFNSALVGDVSIVSNTISGVDSYGNSDILVVDGNLNVQFGEQSTTTQIIASSSYASSSSFSYNNSTGQFRLQSFYLNGTETVATDIPVGSLVTLTANYGPVVVQLTSTLSYFGSEWVANAVLISGASAVAQMGNQAYSFQPISVTSTIDTRVNALEVTETGVNVEGTFTVNGSPIDLSTKQDTLLSGTNIKTVNGTSLLGSGDITITGSGSSFDQELNTTDDVVFNSALVGDVSIVGNTISGTDAYGNADTLIVNGGFNVTFGEQGDVTQTINPTNYASAAYFQYNNSTGEFKLEGNGYLNGTETVSADIPTGALVTFQSNYGPVVVQLTSTLTYVSGNWVATAVVISGASALASSGTPAYGFGSTPILVTTSFDTLVTPLEVTETGVNVEGTFTVNGTNPGLTTNQDGSKSIVVDTTSTDTTTLDMTGYGTLTWILDNNSGRYNFLIPSSAYDLYGQYFTTGTVVTGFFDQAGQGSPFTLTLASDMTLKNISAYSGYAAETVETPPGFPPNSQNAIWANEVTVTNTFGGISDYSFDDQGAFNTTSVIADSALIGDVLIIGNQIAVQDSYGLSGPLNVSASSVEFNSNLNLDIDTLGTETISGGGQFFTANSGTFTHQNMQYSSWGDASKFVTGTKVTIVDYMFRGTIVIELTSDLTFNSGALRWEATYTLVSGSETGNMATSVTITTGGLASYSFDDQGTFTAPTVSTNELSSVSVNSSGNKEIIIVTHNGVDARLTDSTGNVSYQNSFTTRTNTRRSIFEQAVGESNYSFYASSYDTVLGAKTLDDTPKYLNSDLLQYPNGSTSAITTGNSMVNGELIRIKINVCAATQPTTSFTGLKTWEIVAVAYRVGDTTTIIEESKTSTDAGTTTGWDVVIANESGEASIGIKVTGQASTSIHWSARWEQIGEVITL